MSAPIITSAAFTVSVETVAVTSGELIANNEDRMSVIITNRDGTNSIFIDSGVATVAGSYEIAAGESLTLNCESQINAIASVENTSIHVLEETR